MAGEEESKAIEWPGGADEATDFDYLMVGKDGVPIMKIPKEKLNEVIVINGEGVKAVAGGATSANPTILRPGPTDANRKMEDVEGWFVNGTAAEPPVATGSPWEAPTGNKNTNWWDGTTWSLGSSVPLPMQTGVDIIDPVGEELPKEKAVAVYVDDKVGKVATFQDVVDIILDGGFSAIQFDSDTFAGWGTNYGVLKNFNKIRIHHKDLASIVKATKVKYRICENDKNGAVLASGEVDINFTNGQDGYIDISLSSLIENTNSSNIWLEFRGNGNMALMKTATNYSSRKLWYQTTSMSFNNNFAQESLETSTAFTQIPDVKFLHEYQKAVPVDEFSTSVLEKDALGEVESGDQKAVPGDKVKTAIKPFEDVITEEFVVSQTVVISGDAVIQAASTFAGWGQDIGIKKDFNAVSYDVIAFDAANIPTYIEMRIRNGSNTGAILFTVKVPVTLTHNQRTSVTFVLPEVYANPDNLNLFTQFNADGYFASIGSTTGSANGSVKYTTTKGASTVTASVSGAQTLGMKLLKGEYKGVINDAAMAMIKSDIIGDYSDPDLLLTTKVWLYPGSQYNIFNDNVCVPMYGYSRDGYVLDYSGTTGKQYKRGYRLDPVAASLNQNITLTMSKNRKTITTKVLNILSAATNNGNGVVRKVLITGDSTAANDPDGSGRGVISKPLNEIFQASSEVMKISLLGTQGLSPDKHEAEGGRRLEAYVTPGVLRYRINVTGISVNPGINSVYAQSSKNYKVVEVNITAGTGYFTIEQTSGTAGAPSSSGTLTKVSGSGDATISYASSSTNPNNKFYDPDLQRFSIAYYLTTTGQSLSTGDWIMFQIGINDFFEISNIADAKAKATQMIGWMNQILTDIHTYNSGIRVGIVVTFPPSSQDGFGENYNINQTYEMYKKTGLLEWQKALISTYDNDASRSTNTYLISAHLNLDCEYNYPNADVKPNSRYTGSKLINMSINGVHPSNDGYAQIADMYAGLIKYFG